MRARAKSRDRWRQGAAEFRLVLRVAWLLLLAASGQARAAEADFDPTEFLRRRTVEQTLREDAGYVQPSNAVINGTAYVRFDSDVGTLFLPKAGELRREDFRRALCETSFRPSEVQTAVVSAAEIRLAHETAALRDYIREVTVRQCH